MPTGTQTETEDKDSIRSLLSAAMAQHEGGGEEPAEEPAPEPEAPVEAAADEPAPEVETATEAQPEAGRDGKGRFAKQPKAKAPVTPKQPAAAPAQTQPPAQQPAEAAATPKAPAVKPPQSWSPAAREKFATLDPEVQKEVIRRDKEVASALQESAEDRKFASSVRQAISPFEAMIRAEGQEVVPVVQDLLRTAYALRNSPPQHKAAIVANIIRGQGIDPALVGQILQGQAPQAGAQPAQAQHFDPNALAAQVQERIFKQLEQQREQERMAQHQAEISAFLEDPKNEFAEDLRGMMAFLIDEAAHKGLHLTLQQAYDAACERDPQVRGILQQREAAKQANANNASTQRARIASSSIRSQPAGAATAERPEPETLRGALEAAWEASAGRR